MAPSRSRATYIPDLLVEHFEELEYLWQQRASRIRSASFQLRQLRDLEERIEAHVEGLLVPGDDLIRLINEGLFGGDCSGSFSLAFALLRLGSPAAIEKTQTLLAGESVVACPGLRDALRVAPLGRLAPFLHQAVDQGPLPLRALAAESLATHAALGSRASACGALLTAPDAETRAAGWRINALTGFVSGPTDYEQALTDKDSTVRNEAAISAAWQRQSWLLPRIRKLVTTSPDDSPLLTLFVSLAGAEDRVSIQALVTRPDIPLLQRLRWMASWGHPTVIEILIATMEGTDLRAAVLAGEAFTRITGCEIESSKRVTLPPEDGSEPDEFEKEFLDEAKLPDAAKARDCWSKVKAQFASATRLAQGIDLSTSIPPPQVMERLDLQSRWECCLRGKLQGTWSGNAFDLERFPQTKPAPA